jgi:hypothetical protein
MGWIIIVIVSVGCMITIVLATLAAFKLSRAYKSVYLPKNLPLVFNFLPEFTHGYSVGLENKNTKRKNGGTLVEFYPTDIATSDRGDWTTPMDVMQQLFVGKNRRVAFPRGDFSSQREIVFYLPKDISHLSTRMMGTVFGQIITTTTGGLSVLDNFMESVNQQNISQARMMKEYAMGELSIMFLNKLKEMSKEEKEIILQHMLTQGIGGEKQLLKK